MMAGTPADAADDTGVAGAAREAGTPSFTITIAERLFGPLTSLPPASSELVGLLLLGLSLLAAGRVFSREGAKQAEAERNTEAEDKGTVPQVGPKVVWRRSVR